MQSEDGSLLSSLIGLGRTFYACHPFLIPRTVRLGPRILYLLFFLSSRVDPRPHSFTLSVSCLPFPYATAPLLLTKRVPCLSAYLPSLWLRAIVPPTLWLAIVAPCLPVTIQPYNNEDGHSLSSNIVFQEQSDKPLPKLAPHMNLCITSLL